MDKAAKTYLIIPAGGSGKRLNAPIPKQFLEINGIPIIIHTLLKFDILAENVNNSTSINTINKVIIAVNPDWIDFLEEKISEYSIKTPICFVPNGAERQDSVYNALKSSHCSDADYVLIHDAVRPNISKELIERIITEVKQYDGVIPVIPAKDTIKMIDENGIVSQTLERSKLVLVQTPQAFGYQKLLRAFEVALASGKVFTDDASIAEFNGLSVKTIPGEEGNIKITTQEDLKIEISD